MGMAPFVNRLAVAEKLTGVVSYRGAPRQKGLFLRQRLPIAGGQLSCQFCSFLGSPMGPTLCPKVAG